jgi:hypothetical protein
MLLLFGEGTALGVAPALLSYLLQVTSLSPLFYLLVVLISILLTKRQAYCVWLHLCLAKALARHF